MVNVRRMGRRRLLKTVDAVRVKEAIVRAEHRTSGEIRVAVSSLFWGDVYKAAERAFDRMDMHRTRDRNGVLIFVVPARRRFVVLGDSGIHAKVGQSFWANVVQAMSGLFKSGDFTAGLVHGIETIGEELRNHFPYEGTTDTNELPDDVDFDR
jgi:uncharacterized membrane protein